MCDRFFSAAWEYECEAVNFFRQQISPEEYRWCSLTLDSPPRWLATLQTEEPGEWCSSFTSLPCLDSSGFSLLARSLNSSRGSSGSSLPGYLLLVLRVCSSGGQQDKRFLSSSSTSGWLTLWILSDSSSVLYTGKKKKKENLIILLFSKAPQFQVWVS